MSDRRARLASARLYAITPDATPAEVERLVAAWLRGGVDAVQLRHKTLARGQLLSLAERLREPLRAAGALLIVNDHLDIALAAGADGVHLGSEDLSLAAARRVAGSQLLIGATAPTPAAAEVAERSGADYIGAGPAFATPLKSHKPVIGPAGVASVARAVRIPVFAIGGIDAANAGTLVGCGVMRICVIRGLADVPDPEAAARDLKKILGG